MSSANELVLLLFVTGHTVRSERAMRSLRAVCEPVAAEVDLQLTVVDVLEQPELAEQHRVLATPTLLRLRPEPVKRVLGDLTDRHHLALALDLPAEPFPPRPPDDPPAPGTLPFTREDESQ